MAVAMEGGRRYCAGRVVAANSMVSETLRVVLAQRPGMYYPVVCEILCRATKAQSIANDYSTTPTGRA